MILVEQLEYMDVDHDSFLKFSFKSSVPSFKTCISYVISADKSKGGHIVITQLVPLPCSSGRECCRWGLLS